VRGLENLEPEPEGGSLGSRNGQADTDTIKEMIS
jgi:hypothetical protein